MRQHQSKLKKRHTNHRTPQHKLLCAPHCQWLLACLLAISGLFGNPFLRFYWTYTFACFWCGLCGGRVFCSQRLETFFVWHRGIPKQCFCSNQHIPFCLVVDDGRMTSQQSIFTRRSGGQITKKPKPIIGRSTRPWGSLGECRHLRGSIRPPPWSKIWSFLEFLELFGRVAKKWFSVFCGFHFAIVAMLAHNNEMLSLY